MRRVAIIDPVTGQIVKDKQTEVAEKIFAKYQNKFGDDAIYNYRLEDDFVVFDYPMFFDRTAYADDIRKQTDYLMKEAKKEKASFNIYVGAYFVEGKNEI